MISLPNGHLLVETVADLPDYDGTKDLYIDFETTGLDPYLGDTIVGVAMLADEDTQAVYVPTNHFRGKNIPREVFNKWLAETVVKPKRWINHNIKFDAHFAVQAGAVFDCELVDTMTLAKVHDTDIVSYGLKPLCRSLLGMPMGEETRIKAYLKEIGKDNPAGFGALPADLCGEYAAMDVIGTRELYRFLEQERSERVGGIWETEIALTPVLFDMEHRGMRINKLSVKRRALLALRELVGMEGELSELTGIQFTDSNKHLFDLLVVQYGLPIVNYNIKRDQRGKIVDSTPSFDKEAMSLYSVHPAVVGSEKLSQLIELISRYRKLHQFWALYLRPYDELSTEDGTIHPSYNQAVRTGRMSGSHPNPQQLNKEAKELIEPREGCAFLSADASQVEFRWITHYSGDERGIEAYTNDARTDYHQWVADLVGCSRSEGKTINFALGYGAGKAKVTSMLSRSAGIVAEFAEQTADPVEFKDLCEQRALEIWQTYHDKLPGIREVSYRASRVAKLRGHVYNAFGRERHLKPRFAHKAFNAIVQSVAMDYIKTRMNALAPRYCEWMRDAEAHLLINVHDELVFEGPIEVIEDPEFQTRVRSTLEVCSAECRVPMAWDIGTSSRSWREACEDADRRKGGA